MHFSAIYSVQNVDTFWPSGPTMVGILVKLKLVKFYSNPVIKCLLWHRCFLVNFAKFLRTPFQWNSSIELLSNVTKLKEKKKQTHAIQKWIGNKAKYQLETTLINSNIKGRKNVNVKGKDLVSWVAKKQSLTKEFVFCTNCCFLLKYFFVKIQQNWELIMLFVRNYNLN